MAAVVETLSTKAFKKRRKNKKRAEATEDPGLVFVIDSTPSKVPARLEFAEQDSKQENSTANSKIDGLATEELSTVRSVGRGAEDTDELVLDKSDVPGPDGVEAAGFRSREASEDKSISSNSEEEEEEDGADEREAVLDTHVDIFRANEQDEVILHEGIVGDEGDSVSDSVFHDPKKRKMVLIV
jgi:hypothetical protein